MDQLPTKVDEKFQVEEVFCLEIINGYRRNEIHLIGQKITVGQARASDLIIKDPSLSDLHAIFQVKDNIVTVTDTGEGKGIYVGEKKLSSGQRAILKNLEVVLLGEINIRIVKRRKNDPSIITERGEELPPAPTELGEATKTFAEIATGVVRALKEKTQKLFLNSEKDFPDQTSATQMSHREFRADKTSGQFPSDGFDPMANLDKVAKAEDNPPELPKSVETGPFREIEMEGVAELNTEGLLSSKFGNPVVKDKEKPAETANEDEFKSYQKNFKTKGVVLKEKHKGKIAFAGIRFFALLFDFLLAYIIFYRLSQNSQYMADINTIFTRVGEGFSGQLWIKSLFDMGHGRFIEFFDSFKYILLPFLFLQMIFTLLLGQSLGQWLFGMDSNKSFLVSRFGGFIRLILGYLFLPLFFITDAPTLVKRRSLKEFISRVPLYHSYPKKTWFACFIWLPLFFIGLISGDFWLSYLSTNANEISFSKVADKELIEQDFFLAPSMKLWPDYEQVVVQGKTVIKPVLVLYDYELKSQLRITTKKISSWKEIFKNYFRKNPFSAFTQEELFEWLQSSNSLKEKIILAEMKDILEKNLSFNISSFFPHLKKLGPFINGVPFLKDDIMKKAFLLGGQKYFFLNGDKRDFIVFYQDAEKAVGKVKADKTILPLHLSSSAPGLIIKEFSGEQSEMLVKKFFNNFYPSLNNLYHQEFEVKELLTASQKVLEVENEGMPQENLVQRPDLATLWENYLNKNIDAMGQIKVRDQWYFYFYRQGKELFSRKDEEGIRNFKEVLKNWLSTHSRIYRGNEGDFSTDIQKIINALDTNDQKFFELNNI